MTAAQPEHDQAHALQAAGEAFFARWTALWNRAEPAQRLMAPQFTLRYAQPGTEAFDGITTPAQLEQLIADWHAQRPGMVFEAEGPAVVNLRITDHGLAGHVARPYRVRQPGTTARSGIDLLAISAGHLCEVWSASGGRQGRAF